MRTLKNCSDRVLKMLHYRIADRIKCRPYPVGAELRMFHRILKEQQRRGTVKKLRRLP